MPGWGKYLQVSRPLQLQMNLAWGSRSVRPARCRQQLWSSSKETYASSRTALPTTNPPGNLSTEDNTDCEAIWVMWCLWRNLKLAKRFPFISLQHPRDFSEGFRSPILVFHYFPTRCDKPRLWFELCFGTVWWTRIIMLYIYAHCKFCPTIFIVLSLRLDILCFSAASTVSLSLLI